METPTSKPTNPRSPWILWTEVLLNLAPSETRMQFRISDVCWSGSGKYRCPAYFEKAKVRDLAWKKTGFGERFFFGWQVYNIYIYFYFYYYYYYYYFFG